MGMSLSAKIVYGIVLPGPEDDAWDAYDQLIGDDYDGVEVILDAASGVTDRVGPKPDFETEREAWDAWCDARRAARQALRFSVDTTYGGVTDWTYAVIGVVLATTWHDATDIASSLTREITQEQRALLDKIAAYLNENGVPAKVGTYLFGCYW